MFFRVGILFLGLACLGCAHQSSIQGGAFDGGASYPNVALESAEDAAPPLPAPETKPQNPVPVVSATEWIVVPGFLRGQLEGWASQAGYQLIWKARHDYEMHSQSIFRESFVDSVKRLFNRMHAHGNLLRVTIYEVNQVIEVTED